MNISVYKAFYLPAGAGRPAGHISLAKRHQLGINNISKLIKTYKIISTAFILKKGVTAKEILVRQKRKITQKAKLRCWATKTTALRII